MRVIVGLRNPGTEYEGTRHNVGFEMVRVLAARAGLELRRGPLRTRCQVGEFRHGAERVVLGVPNGFMNTSGGPVKSLLGYFKVEPPALLVAHDDIDLDFGRLRLQIGGGHGGHNGVRSMIQTLGTPDFARLKIGVGRPPGTMDPAEYVLRPFSKPEKPEVDLLVEDAADVAELWIDDPARAQERAAHRRLRA